MKIGWKSILFAIALGLFAWVADAVLDHFVSYQGQGTFWGMLITNVPVREVYVRMVAFVVFAALGLLLSRALTSRRRDAALFTEQKGLMIRVLVPLAVVLAAIFGAFVLGAYQHQRRQIDKDVAARLATTRGILDLLIEQEAQSLSAAMAAVRRDEKIRAAWQAHDRDRLLALARPLHQRFHAEQNITHFYFHDTDRVNFLRVHKPDRYGDVIDRFTMMKTAKTAEPASGIELGPLGTLTLRAVHPWRIDGRLIGYIELGMGVDHLVKELRESLGIDVMLLVDKRFLKRRDWVAGMRMLGRKADWEQFADSVVANRTIEHVPPEMTKWLNQAHRDQTKGHFEVTIEGRRHSVGSLRLRDVSGREIGDIVVFHDATAQYAALRRFIGFLAAVCADAGIGLFVLFYVILGRAQRSLQAAHAKALEESHARQEQQEHHYAEARRKQEFLENMVESLTHPFCVIDANDYTVKLANSAILGDRPLGHQTCYALTHKRDKPCKGEHTCPLEEVKRTKKPVTVEHVHYDRDGNALDVEVHGYPIFDSEGNVVQMIEYCLDITQRKRAEQAVADKSRQLEKANRLLAKQAKYDELTHILNRRGFYEVLSAEAERVHRYASPLAIVMCDIDHFKRINDLYGHDFGDVVLREVASILDSESRNVDTTARYGGDEFMIVLPSTSCDKAYQVAERIRARLAEATITDGKHEVQITASFGVAGIEAGEDAAATELPRLADEALYAAKRAGRNRTVNRRDTTDGHTSPHVKAGAGKVG